MFDLEGIFAQVDVRFWTSGKNTAPGWVNIQCPFCDDHSNHLGVNIDSGFYHCWKCDADDGNIYDLLGHLTNLSRTEINKLVREYRSDFVISRTKKEKKAFAEQPMPATLPRLADIHREYLESRRFDPDEIVAKYRVRATHIAGKWKFRLIIPVIFDGRSVNFTALDVTGEQDPKYLHCPNESAIMDMKSILYNIDTVEKRIIICEGVTDVWRMGDGAVATFGTQFTDRQLKLVADRVKEAWVLYDSDAVKKGERLAYQLSGVVGKVENISLSKGDPADLSPAMVRKIRRWVWGS